MVEARVTKTFRVPHDGGVKIYRPGDVAQGADAQKGVREGSAVRIDGDGNDYVPKQRARQAPKNKAKPAPANK